MNKISWIKGLTGFFLVLVVLVPKLWLGMPSLACEQLGQIPLSQLAAILEPAMFTLTKQPNTNPATQDNQPFLVN
ncbi:MAG: hypothetical protein KAI83_14070 [Thiomargarita sp.]|nr:hypothetical protein [Thiomargarita sp.]